MSADLLSPMDAFPWFEAPAQTAFLTPAPGDRLCGLEPRRVVLILSLTSVPDSCQLSAVPVVGSVAGLVLSTAAPFIILTQQEHGALCQYPWFVNQAPAGGLVVIEQFLREWPPERAGREVVNGPQK